MSIRPEIFRRIRHRPHNRLRVAVLDPDAARPGLLPLVVAHNLVLNRYEWVRPSLEEIFLTLSQ